MAPWLRVKVNVRGEENKSTDTDDNDCGATDPLSYHSSWALSWLWWKRKRGTEVAVTPRRGKAKACEGEARESPTNVACDGASVWPWKAWPQDAHEELHASDPTPAPPPVLLAGVVGGGKRSAREEAIEEMRYAAAKIAFVAEADIDLVPSAKFVARVAQLAASHTLQDAEASSRGTDCHSLFFARSSSSSADAGLYYRSRSHGLQHGRRVLMRRLTTVPLVDVLLCVASRCGQDCASALADVMLVNGSLRSGPVRWRCLKFGSGRVSGSSACVCHFDSVSANLAEPQ